MFGAKIKIVSGYPGGNDVNLAMERREIDGRCGWSWDSIRSTRPDWLRDKKIDLLLVFALEKSPEIPAEVPLALDKAPSEEMRQILRVHLAGQAFGRPFAAPPGIPADRKAALRDGLRRHHEGPGVRRRGDQGGPGGEPDHRRGDRPAAGRRSMRCRRT